MAQLQQGVYEFALNYLFMKRIWISNESTWV